MAFRLLVAVVLAAALAAEQRFPLNKLDSSGQNRLSEQAVLLASGLKLRQSVENGDFVKACDQIVNSGFFRSCNFRYDPLTVGGVDGYDVHFVVEEIAETQAATIEIPGLSEDDLWNELAKQDPLLQRKVPATDAATNRYVAAIEELLTRRGVPRKIEQKIEGKLGGGPVLLVFQAVDLPTVHAAVFEGNHVISSEQLRSAIMKSAAGAQFTERRFKQLLELNVRPLYNEIGRLDAKFSSITITPTQGAGTVSTTVDEGPSYSLGAVEITGDSLEVDQLMKQAAFQSGKVANWRLVEESIERIRTVFKTDGFLFPSVQQNRVLRPNNAADLRLSIAKGRQYFFGQLTLSGLDEGQEKKAREGWNLASGAPMNELYVGQFLKKLLEDRRLPPGKQASQTLQMDQARPGVVNVLIRFR